MAFRSSLVLLVSAAVMLVAPSVVRAQSQGALSGTVTSRGVPLPGAAVQVTGPSGPLYGTTDSQGRYSIPNLPPGTYTMGVTLYGFAPFTTTVTMEPGRSRNMDVELTTMPLMDRINVRVEGGAGVAGSDDLFINQDVATTEDLFNGSIVRTTRIVNTLEAREDLTFRERLKFFRLGLAANPPEFGQSLGSTIRVGVTGGGQLVAFEDPSGKLTEISGIGFGGYLGADLDWRLSPPSVTSVNQTLRFSFDGSLSTVNDAERDPAQTSVGTVTGDSYDIKVRRMSFGLSYVRSTPKTTYRLGGERYSDTFNLDRTLDFDFSNIQAGVGLHVDGETDLSKSGFRVMAGLDYQATPRLAVKAEGAVGPDSWRAIIRMQLRVY